MFRELDPKLTRSLTMRSVESGPPFAKLVRLRATATVPDASVSKHPNQRQGVNKLEEMIVS